MSIIIMKSVSESYCHGVDLMNGRGRHPPRFEKYYDQFWRPHVTKLHSARHDAL